MFGHSLNGVITHCWFRVMLCGYYRNKRWFSPLHVTVDCWQLQLWLFSMMSWMAIVAVLWLLCPTPINIIRESIVKLRHSQFDVGASVRYDRYYHKPQELRNSFTRSTSTASSLHCTQSNSHCKKVLFLIWKLNVYFLSNSLFHSSSFILRHQ